MSGTEKTVTISAHRYCDATFFHHVGNWTQGLVHARQMFSMTLNNLNICYVYIWEKFHFCYSINHEFSRLKKSLIMQSFGRLFRYVPWILFFFFSPLVKVMRMGTIKRSRNQKVPVKGKEETGIRIHHSSGVQAALQFLTSCFLSTTWGEPLQLYLYYMHLKNTYSQKSELRDFGD
jgi:hypothetical protein